VESQDIVSEVESRKFCFCPYFEVVLLHSYI